ncbi:MAG: thiamine diphosphokinase [Firmicutes bacterium]|nr:thiamine diphosphokinase [Bacillota bacterium]
MGKGKFHRGLIFCNGEFSPEDVPAVRETDLVICADGGLGHARAVGLTPHVVLGDFDSLKSADQKYLHSHRGTIEVFQYPAEKDKTDGQLAVEYALDAGVQEIWIFGALGGRIDHTLGNILLGRLCIDRGVALWLVGHRQHVCMLRGPTEALVKGSPKDYVSLLPLTTTASGVTTAGLYYPLQEATLYLGETRGLSNELTGNTGKVEVKDGTLLVVRTNRDEGNHTTGHSR